MQKVAAGARPNATANRSRAAEWHATMRGLMQTEENDVPQYPKGDLRQMLSVLAAMDSIKDATLVKLVARTGVDKKTVATLVQQAIEQVGVRIEKEGLVYRLTDWGPVIKRSGAKMALMGTLNPPEPTVPARAT